jgi:hypothetical protein
MGQYRNCYVKVRYQPISRHSPFMKLFPFFSFFLASFIRCLDALFLFLNIFCSLLFVIDFDNLIFPRWSVRPFKLLWTYFTVLIFSIWPSGGEGGEGGLKVWNLDPGGQKWPENYKTFYKFHLMKCWMFSIEGWRFLLYSSLEVLYGGLGIIKLQSLIKIIQGADDKLGQTPRTLLKL